MSLSRLLTLGILLGALGSAPAPAVAAPYVITRCTYSELPSSPAPVRSPLLETVGTIPLDQCGPGFGYKFDFSNHTLNTSASGRTGARFKLATTTPDLTIVGVTARLSLASKTGDAQSSGSLAFVDETNAITANLASWGGGSTAQIGPADFTTPANWKPTRSVLLGATCATTCTFATRPERDLKVESLKFTLDDPSPPDAPTFPATGLFAGGSTQGVQPLSVTAADNGSGVSHVEVLTPGGVLVGATLAKANCRFHYAEACPPVRTLSVPVDTATLAPGPQRVSVRIFNPAGLLRTVDTPEFTVAGAGTVPAPVAPLAPVLVPNGDSLGRAAISATKGTPGARRSLTVPFGSTVRLRGRVLNRDRKPMAGVAIDVLRTPSTVGSSTDQPRTVIATLTTSPSGRYEYRYVASASASVELAYAKYRGGTEFEATRAIAITVKPKLTLRAASPSAKRGARVVFSGQLTFDPQPGPGTPIGIQVLRGRTWQSVDVVTVKAGGRFSWSHTFRTQGRYRFRARTFKSGSLPQTSSAPAALRVG